MPKNGFAHILLLLILVITVVVTTFIISSFKNKQEISFQTTNNTKQANTLLDALSGQSEKIRNTPHKTSAEETECKGRQNNTIKQSQNATSYGVTNADIDLQFDYSKGLYFNSEYFYNANTYNDSTIYGCILLIELGYPSKHVGPDAISQEADLFYLPASAIEHGLSVQVTTNRFASLDDYYTNAKNNTLAWYGDSFKNPYIIDIKESILIDGQKCLKWTHKTEPITDGIPITASYICLLNEYIYEFNAFSFDENSQIFKDINKTVEDAKFLN